MSWIIKKLNALAPAIGAMFFLVGLTACGDSATEKPGPSKLRQESKRLPLTRELEKRGLFQKKGSALSNECF